MIFYSQVNRPETKPNKSGSPFIPEYQERINEETGLTELVEIGKINVYEQIQEAAPDTEITTIIKRAAMGDLSVLKQSDPTYIDATTMPKSLMEAQNIVIKAKQEFENMPDEIKNMFNNNPEKYVAEMGSKEFLEKMSPYINKIKDIREAGNLKEYNKKVSEQAKFEKDVAAAKEVNE